LYLSAEPVLIPPPGRFPAAFGPFPLILCFSIFARLANFARLAELFTRLAELFTRLAELFTRLAEL
jgi:hypothetical protein